MKQRDIVDVAVTPPTYYILPADKRQVTDRRPQTHFPTSQKLVFCARLSINGCIDPLTPTCVHAFTRSKLPASLHSLIHCFIASLFASSSQGPSPWNNARGRSSPQASWIRPRHDERGVGAVSRATKHDETERHCRGSFS